MKKSVILKAMIVFWIVAAAMLSCTVTVSANPDGPVHTLYWKAKIHRNVKVKKKTVLKKGSYVVVVKRNYKRSGSSLVRWAHGTVKVPNSSLSYVGDLTTIVKQGDYKTSVKEKFVNNKGIKSRTKWMCWVSLDKQRVNIFKGSKRKWKLQKVFPCSSGKATTPTFYGSAKIDFKNRRLRGLDWYVDISGGGFHDWPGKLNPALLGKHTASKGCVRLRYNDAKWLYKHVPTKSRVYVY